MERKVVGIECRHATHVPKTDSHPDVHLVKEWVHYDDGSVEPNIRTIKNFQRPFWITKKRFRNHKEKKEWEMTEKLDKYTVTQSDLVSAASKYLDMRSSYISQRSLSSNPYLYGSDITSSSLIKAAYQTRYPDVQSNYFAMAFDTETDVVNGTNETIISTLAWGKNSHVVVSRAWLEGGANFGTLTEDYGKLVEQYLSPFINTKEHHWTIELADSEIDIFKRTFAVAHRVKPDFMSIWNMSYDVVKIMEACERAGIKPEDLLSDPEIPPDLRYFKWTPGRTSKKTASGKHIPIKPAAQWHSAISTSSFQFVDAMSSYKLLRTGSQEEKSYALGAILDKLFNFRKLNFKEADGYSGISWHKFMQANHKLLYVLYGQFDTISMVLADNKTQDLTVKLPVWMSITDLAVANKQPKIAADRLHFFVQQHQYVIASTGIVDEVEDETMGLNKWVLCLPADRVKPNGLKVILENPDQETNIQGHCRDADKISSYPSATQALNLSKETGSKEIIDITGIPKETYRLQNINLLSGHVNAVEYCATMFGFPSPTELIGFLREDGHI